MKSRYLPDLVISVAAFVIGGALALFLHRKWYCGGWMGAFGDPPDVNPAYDYFARLFQMAPYVAGGLAVGWTSGFGCPQPLRLLIRFASVVLLFLFSLASDRQDRFSSLRDYLSRIFICWLPIESN